MLKKLILSSILALSVTGAAHAAVSDAVRDDGFGLHLTYPAIHTHKGSTMNTLNKFVRFYVDDAIRVYEGNMYDEVYMNYDVTYEDARYVSVVISTTFQKHSLAHPENREYAFILDKKTGERADLSRLLPNHKELVKALKEEKLVLLSGKNKKVLYDDSFMPEKASENYFLTKDGHVAILYDRGELAPSYMGSTYVVLPDTLK